MEQVLFGGWYDLLDPAATEYTPLSGGYNWTGTESWRRRVVSTDGVIKNLKVMLSGSPGGGKKYTFTLMLNENPTALTFDIADADTIGSNMVNQITVTGGDRISLRCDPDGTPTAVYAYWTSTFEGDNPCESLILGGSGGSIDNVNTIYGQLMCAFTSYSITENDFRQVMPTSGTIENFYVNMALSPGSDPDAYRFTVRINGGTDGNSPIVTIIAPATTGNDLVNSLPVVAGDILTIMIEPLNTPSTTTHVRWGLTFVADINGESIVMGGARDNLSDTDTKYMILTGWGGRSWHPDETIRYQLGQNCTWKKLNILLSGSPGAGNKYDFTLRIAGADSNVVATVSDAAITGNSGALEDTVADEEYLDLQVIPDDTPTVRDAYWGFVSYISPFEDGSAELLGQAVIRQLTSVELFSKFLIPAIYSIAGITKDKAGNRLGNCGVALFRTMAGNPPTYLFIKSDTSDANGDYLLTNLIRTNYFVRAHKDGSPNVFDTTDNEIVPV